MPQRTLTGRLVDATRQPLANIDVKVWPGWPTPAGIPDPAADVLMVRRHLHAKTDATGTFTITGLETTSAGVLADWCYRMQFTVDQTQADVAFLLPAGSGVAQLADVMLAEVTPGAGQFVVVAGAAEAVAAAAQAEAAAARAQTAVGTTAVKLTGWNSGWTAPAGDVYVRRAAGWGWLSGIVCRVSGAETNLLYLPTGYRPESSVRAVPLAANSGNTAGPPLSFSVEPNGAVSISGRNSSSPAWSASTWIELPTIPYRLAS